MKITSFEFAYIKSYKSLKFDFNKTNTLIGQNDHGKSSILKAIDIVLNKLNPSTVDDCLLHPDLSELLLPIFKVDGKARRITINYIHNKIQKSIYITFRTDLTYTVTEEVTKGSKTTSESIKKFNEVKEKNKFILIPAIRDTNSDKFQELFSKLLKDHGLSKIIPQKVGGTPKEYRALKSIREQISTTISPYINASLLPQIESHFGFETQHKLALKFDVDVKGVGEWILENLRLGFSLGDDSATIGLSEAGTGVQSGVLLALNRLEQSSQQYPDVQFLLAIEEPEAFLHPQKQKELLQNIKSISSQNLKIIITTHSPYIISETPFSELGLVKKDGNISSLHIPIIKDTHEEEMFNAYSNEVNSQLFFAEKVIFVEGESDIRVLKTILQKKLGSAAHKISIISSSGNKNFSPFLNMVKSLASAKIKHLVITDFDSLTKDSDRAIITGAKAAGFTNSNEAQLHTIIDNALDKGEAEFRAAADAAEAYFKASGLNVFIFTSDLEYSIINESNKNLVTGILNSISNKNPDYSNGYSLDSLRKNIGSKTVPLNPMDKPKFKKPFIHKKIAETIDLETSSNDIKRILDLIENL